MVADRYNIVIAGKGICSYKGRSASIRIIKIGTCPYSYIVFSSPVGISGERSQIGISICIIIIIRAVVIPPGIGTHCSIVTTILGGGKRGCTNGCIMGAGAVIGQAGVTDRRVVVPVFTVEAGFITHISIAITSGIVSSCRTAQKGIIITS